MGSVQLFIEKNGSKFTWRRRY